MCPESFNNSVGGLLAQRTASECGDAPCSLSGRRVTTESAALSSVRPRRRGPFHLAMFMGDYLKAPAVYRCECVRSNIHNSRGVRRFWYGCKLEAQQRWGGGGRGGWRSTDGNIALCCKGWGGDIAFSATQMHNCCLQTAICAKSRWKTADTMKQ